MGRENVVERHQDYEEKAESGVLTMRGVDEKIRVLQAEHQGAGSILPWRFKVDAPRAALFAMHAGIGYLL